MKLLNYTTSIFSGILFMLLSLWAILFYFEMLDEIYDSLDDGLENQKMQVIKRVRERPELLQNTSLENGFTVREVHKTGVLEFTDTYRDTLMYMQNERDYEPVRLLESVFEQDGKYYKMKVLTSMVEEDDLVKELFFGLLWLYFGLILSTILLNNFLHRRIWKPFYKLLARLGAFSIEKDSDITTEPTNIDEFKLLNTQIEKLLRKSVESFKIQKQFIENSSHELQTPLAISINKLELMVENEQLTDQQVEELGQVIANLERLTRFNKSLLLLSKIENKQFPEEEKVNFNQLVKQVCEQFQDLAKHREMEFELQEDSQLEFRMNKDLAAILVSNLLKNALVHGRKQSRILIEFQQRGLQISNSGHDKALDPEKFTSRFQQTGGSRKSVGLGLAISKAIADRFGLKFSYNYKVLHIFRIDLPRKNNSL